MKVLAFLALFFIGCASTQITQPLKEQEQRNTKVKDEIKNNPKLTPQEKQEYAAAIDETEKLAEKCDKQETNDKEEIASLKEEIGRLNKYFWIFWSSVVALGIGVFLKFRSSLFSLFQRPS